MEILPYLKNKVKNTIFGDSDEIRIDQFKDKSVDLRLGGKDWLPLAKDLEEAKIIRFENGKIKLIK